MGAFVVRDARKRSPFWYAVYRDATGRRIKKSTKLTSKTKALEVARTLEKASSEARQRTLTESRTRDLFSEVLQTVNGEGLARLHAGRLVRAFRQGQAQVSAAATGSATLKCRASLSSSSARAPSSTSQRSRRKTSQRFATIASR